MADNYATIQQHQPLRTPAGWGRQEKALIVQLDEIFDDLYRRFGRLRLADMGKAFQKQIADDEGNIAQLTLDVSGLVIEVDNKISKTTAYQTADSIVTAAVSQAAISASQTYIAKTSTYQDASSIVTAAEGYTDGLLISYSTTSQMNDAINLSVAGIAPAFSTSAAYAVGDIVSYNGKIYKFTSAHSAGAWNSSQVTQTSLSSDAYLVQSGIVIDANGIDITGSKYVKIRSGGSFYASATDFTIDSANKLFDLGNWQFRAGYIKHVTYDPNNPSSYYEHEITAEYNGGMEISFRDPSVGDNVIYHFTNHSFYSRNNYAVTPAARENLGNSDYPWGTVYGQYMLTDTVRSLTGGSLNILTPAISGSMAEEGVHIERTKESGTVYITLSAIDVQSLVTPKLRFRGNADTATKLSRAPTYGELSGR